MRTAIADRVLARVLIAAALASVAASSGCVPEDGDAGVAGPTGPAGTTPTEKGGDKWYTAPGVVVTVTGLAGGTAVGSTLTVTYRVRKSDGSNWSLAEMDQGGIMVSGPSFNYQPVIPEQSDLLTRSVALGNGTYRYTFASAMPATYPAPANDSASFGAADGELQGQNLLAGTYTVGLHLVWDYDVEGTTYHDVGETVANFRFGGATTIVPREVVTAANCNACHQQVRAHEDERRDVRTCVLCHTSGAEDQNVATIAGGTPGRSIDFRVLIHQLHSGANLPSVLGVSTTGTGARTYSATPVPLRYVDAQGAIDDHSTTAFPQFPNLTAAMPKDQGNSSLTTAQQALEDQMRKGPTNCAACHAGAAQGTLYKTQPSRRACGSCHDDVVWSNPYVANGQTMNANQTDASCTTCHAGSGAALAIDDAHLHPLKNATLNPGLVVTLSSVAEAGTNDGDGTLDPGEKVAVTFSLTDFAGGAVAASGLNSLSAVFAGPTTNRQVLLSTSLPLAAITGSSPYTLNLPQAVVFELVGASTATTGDVFTTARTPHWNVTGATTTVRVRTGNGLGATTLATAAAALQNFVQVGSVTNFARNDVVVVDDGAGAEEYLTVALVDGLRLWVTTPLRNAHAVNAAVQEVTVATVPAASYTLTAASGQITETTEFGTGDVLVSYTSDYLVPSLYPPPINDSPDLDETWGEWQGKSLVSGTYTVGLWGYRDVVVALFSETQTYRGTSTATTIDVLVGSATSVTPYVLITGGANNCNACHDDLSFHGGGRLGFDTCVLCHGASGGEDRARYTAGNAPATTGTTIEFRTMLHKIHRGKDLANAATYTVNGYGSGAYPNNFTAHTYGTIGFPAMPGGVKNCALCHGATNTAWTVPSNRDHPSAQVAPVRSWRSVCGSCHDDTAAAAHFALQTTAGGLESCSVCHGLGRQYEIPVSHRTR